MCFICDTAREAAREPESGSARDAVKTLAIAHRLHVAESLSRNPRLAWALLRETPEGGCPITLQLNEDSATGNYTLEVRSDDAQYGMRVTYANVDFHASVAYTGNGPEGQSRIGIDAIVSALDFVNSKETGLGVMLEHGTLRGRGVNVENELEMTRLVKRCLVALREIAEKDSSAE